MPVFLSPGVFIQDVSDNVEPIEGVSVSNGAFVGLAERGPEDTPVEISSFAEFNEKFGDFLVDGYLAYGVSSFFAEGGEKCYVVRVSRDNAFAANVALNGADASASLILRAGSVGDWGNRLEIAIGDASNGTAEDFKLTIRYHLGRPGEFTDAVDGTLIIEEFDNLNTDNMAAVVNNGSSFIFAEYLPLADQAQETLRSAADKRPANNTPDVFTGLTGGSNGIGTPNFIGTEADGRGLHAFDKVEDINIVSVPDLAGNRDTTAQAVAYCENRGDCFFLLDPPPGLDVQGILDYKRGAGSYEGNVFNSTFGALYYPWLSVNDPLTGNVRSIPASGAVAGIYAKTDRARGVFKAPAGRMDGKMTSAVGMERLTQPEEQDLLNPEGINVLRAFPGAGVVVWGARTLSPRDAFRFVNVRRLVNFIEATLKQESNFAVFEPNTPTAWGRIRRRMNTFLMSMWRAGALVGEVPDEAFIIKVDQENNPAEIRDAGRLIVDVGIAPTRPAEFIVVRVKQRSLVTA